MPEEFTIKDIVQDIRQDFKDFKEDNRLAHQRIETNSEKSFKQIVEQTTKHNSRMKKLEEWKATIKGALIITNIVVVAVLIPVTFIFVKQYVNLDEKISTSLSIELDKKLNE